MPALIWIVRREMDRWRNDCRLMPVDRVELGKPHYLLRNLARAVSRSTLPLTQKYEICRNRAIHFTQMLKTNNSSYVRPISDSDSSSCMPADKGSNSAVGVASMKSDQSLPPMLLWSRDCDGRPASRFPCVHKPSA